MNCKTCAGPCCLKGSNHEGDCEGYKPMTRYDHIRAMSVDEMARWMASNVDCQYCSVRGEWCTESEAACKRNWLGWLRQEASDGVL